MYRLSHGDLAQTSVFNWCRRISYDSFDSLPVKSQATSMDCGLLPGQVLRNCSVVAILLNTLWWGAIAGVGLPCVSILLVRKQVCIFCLDVAALKVEQMRPWPPRWKNGNEAAVNQPFYLDCDDSAICALSGIMLTIWLDRIVQFCFFFSRLPVCVGLAQLKIDDRAPLLWYHWIVCVCVCVCAK